MPAEKKFPENFLWGASISAYQAEGNNKHSDWWEWEVGRTEDGSMSGLACDHYFRYAEDIKIMKRLNLTCFRLGIEWSRIEPEKGKINFEEIRHYRNVLSDLRRNGIKTMVTLHHFTSPAWLAEEGGWESGMAVEHFVDYSKTVVLELGGLIDYVITINEPMIFLNQGFIRKKWPPQKGSVRSAKRAYQNIVAAHRSCFREIKKIQPKILVSIAKNNVFREPFRLKSCLDKWAVRKADYDWNMKILEDLKDSLDFIGLNYYFHDRIKFFPFKRFPYFCRSKNDNIKTTDMKWEIFPRGIYEVIRQLSPFKLPIIITENGLADSQDHQRSQFIYEHLEQIHRAIGEGAEVFGYLHWSLLDNFEWLHGFRPRFGLVEVDYRTYERKIRPSAFYYAQIAKSNSLVSYER